MNEILKKRIEEGMADYADNLYPKYFPQHSIARIAFSAGAEYALSHQWISVEDALPKEDFDVFMNVYVEVNTGHGIEHCVLLATYASGKFSCETKHVKVIGWMYIPKFETKTE